MFALSYRGGAPRPTPFAVAAAATATATATATTTAALLVGVLLVVLILTLVILPIARRVVLFLASRGSTSLWESRVHLRATSDVGPRTNVWPSQHYERFQSKRSWGFLNTSSVNLADDDR
jgi:hypothetical protein